MAYVILLGVADAPDSEELRVGYAVFAALGVGGVVVEIVYIYIFE